MKKVENRLHKYYCEYCDYKCVTNNALETTYYDT